MIVQKPHSLKLREAAFSILTNELMPFEAHISMPVPIVRDSKLIAGFFLAMTMPIEGSTNSNLYAPDFHILVDWDSESVVEWRKVRADVALVDDEPVSKLYTEKFVGSGALHHGDFMLDAINELHRSLDVIGLFYSRGIQEESERGLLGYHLALLESILNESSFPFYSALNPEFFDWLNEESRDPRPFVTPKKVDGLCSGCNAINPTSSRFCNQCGAPLT